MKTIIITILLTFTSNLFASDYIYQKCLKKEGKLVCEFISGQHISFKSTQKEDLQPNKCFYRETNKNYVFYRINKIKGTLYFAFTQAINKQTNQWDYKLYHEFYSWGGMNLNNELKPIDCSETPNLSSVDYIKQKCGYFNQSKATLYCEQERPKRRIFGEREF